MVLHKELYASIALLAGVMYFGMMYFTVPELITTIATLVVGFTARMATVQLRWRLPVFVLEEPKEDKLLENKTKKAEKPLSFSAFLFVSAR